MAENPSRSLHKVSEIYDRIAFAGVGKYNEFDQLRVAGVRHADTKGFAFSREDVDARSLANLYAQFLGQVFTHEMKPLEVEVLVAELGTEPRADQLYHIAYEGTITDEDHFAVLGGEAETITARVAAAFVDGWDLDAALRARGGRSGRPRPHPRGRGPRGGRSGPDHRPTGLPPDAAVEELAERLAAPRRGGRGRKVAAADPGGRFREPRVDTGRADPPQTSSRVPRLRSSNRASTWSAMRSSRASSAWFWTDQHLDRSGQGIGPVAATA